MRNITRILLCLTLPVIFACSAKVAVDGNSEIAENLSSSGTSFGEIRSSSETSSSSAPLSSSLSAEATQPSETATSSSAYASSSSLSANHSEFLIFKTEQVLEFDKTRQHILTQPSTFFCMGGINPVSGSKSVWLYWIESSTLYTTTDEASSCSSLNCSEETATSLLSLSAENQWTGGTDILDTWIGEDSTALRISDESVDFLIRGSSITDISSYYPNAVGAGSSAQQISPSMIEIPYQGHTLRFSLETTLSQDTLKAYHVVVSEDGNECRSSFYFYQAGSEPSTCPWDSNVNGTTCTEAFVTDIENKELCDLNRLNDGSCDDYCLNFDDAVDCTNIGLNKRPLRKSKTPFSKLGF